MFSFDINQPKVSVQAEWRQRPFFNKSLYLHVHKMGADDQALDENTYLFIIQ